LKKSASRFACVLVGLGILMSLVAPGTAWAAGTEPAPASGFICAPGANPATTGGTSGATSITGPYLPIDRWASVAGPDLHSNLSGGFLGVDDLGQEANREIQSFTLTMGNALWQAGADLVSMGAEFCFAPSVAAAVDNTAATLGNALVSSGLVVAVVVVAIAVLIARARKGASPWRALGRLAVFCGVLGAMLAGASATHVNPATGQVDFGVASPGWLIDNTYAAISRFASAPTAALASTPLGTSGASTGLASTGPLSCGAYTQSLVDDYKSSYGVGAVAQAPASLPLAVNDMWEQSGLVTYMEVQFGASNPYGAVVYCHLLDYNDGYSPTQQTLVAGQSLPAGTTLTPQALAWPSPADSNQAVDASIIGWAACQGTPGHWVIDTSWYLTGVVPQTCDSWWSQPAIPGPLDWGPGDGSGIVSVGQSMISQGHSATDVNQFENFLLTFHGDSGGTSDVAAITYMGTSVVVFAVFGLLAVAVLIAKVALLVVMMLIAVVVLMSLWPGHGPGKLSQVTRYTVGLVVFATGAQLALALVALTTGVVSDVVTSFSGQGSYLDVLATGLAPVGAVVVLHMVFTKILKVPSPFKMSGALAWGASLGSIGGGAAGFVNRQFDQRSKSLVRSAGRSVMSHYGAPRVDRSSSMPPIPVSSPKPVPPKAPSGSGTASSGAPSAPSAPASLPSSPSPNAVPAAATAPGPEPGPGGNGTGPKAPHAAPGPVVPVDQAAPASAADEAIPSTNGAKPTRPRPAPGGQPDSGLDDQAPPAGAKSPSTATGPGHAPDSGDSGLDDQAPPAGAPAATGPGHAPDGLDSGLDDQAPPAGAKSPSTATGPGHAPDGGDSGLDDQAPPAGAPGATGPGHAPGGQPDGGPAPGAEGPSTATGPAQASGDDGPDDGPAPGAPKDAGGTRYGPNQAPGANAGPRQPPPGANGARRTGPRPAASSTGTGAGRSQQRRPSDDRSWRAKAYDAHRAEAIGKALLRAQQGNILARSGNNISERARLALARAQERPVRTALKAGAVGVGIVVATAGAPLAIGAGALYAGHKALQFRAEAPERKREANAHRARALAAYRTWLADQARLVPREAPEAPTS